MRRVVICKFTGWPQFLVFLRRYRPHAQPLNFAATYGAIAVISRTRSHMSPSLKVYASRICGHGLPWIRRPNANSNTMVRHNQPKPMATYLATDARPIHGSAKYATARMAPDRRTPLRMSPGGFPSVGIRITSRSAPFAMANTRMLSHIANALIASLRIKKISSSANE